MVVGHNIDWKQNSPMWDKDNQNFVGIPFAKFISILKIVGLKSSINVVDFEESYTSKTSFIDNDFIPTYVKGDTEEHIFSGKRQKRGLYISKDGYKINADVNGSLNIIRKHFGDSAFNGIDRTSYAKKTIETLDFVDFYPQNCKRKKEACVKPKG
jgi:transposase